MRGILAALEKEEEDVSEAEGMGGGVKTVYFSAVLTCCFCLSNLSLGYTKQIWISKLLTIKKSIIII